jgi:hypothetical protein
MILVGITRAKPDTPQLANQAPQVSGVVHSKSTVRDLVNVLSDPSNEVRAKAAAALLPIVAADPSIAPNWHNKTFWSKRVEKTNSGMLLDDALGILLPELSMEQRNKTLIGADWSGGSGVSICQLDDYWRATFPLKDFDKPQLIERPILEPSVCHEWVKPPEHFTGLWVTWYVNGQKANEIEYRDGKYDGTFTAFYDNGSKAYKQHYKAHVCVGAEIGWHKSGKNAYEGEYKDGKQDGVWRHWYENGQLASQSTYKNG